MNRCPLWIPFLVVCIIAVSTWGTLHIYTGTAIHGLIPSSDIVRVVSGVAAVGNVIAALGLLVHWPIITLVLWAAGTLLNGRTPEYKALLHAVGLAAIPIAVGTLIVWSITVLDPPADFAGALNLKETLQARPSVRLGQSVMIACYACTLIWLVAIMHRAFRLSWVRAAFAVVVPFGIVGICRIWI